MHGWAREQGDYEGVTRELLGAGAAIPKPDRPLEAPEELLAIVQRAEEQRAADDKGGA